MMKTTHLLGLLAIPACVFLWTGPVRADDPASADFFEKKIRPVLVDHCYKCHSSTSKRLKANLRLDTRAGILKGGDTGAMILPGKSAESLLIKALRYEDLEMPPEGKLPDNVVNDFVAWIKVGAPVPEDKQKVAVDVSGSIDFEAGRKFWSFQPLNLKRQQGDSIDRFVQQTLDANKLPALDRADKRTLIRRATFDLIGLPPTPAEIEAFEKDETPEAFAKVIERLLASPHYGERWARHWLDLARYGEDQAHSFKPRLYPNGYRYRDWVVNAFNADLPYDRFVKEQIAADLLAGKDQTENLPALGFFAVGPVYYGDRLKYDQIDDRIDTLSRTFLGLTVACARCHDHKFDPISTKDYYALAGVIASTDYVEAPLASAEVVAAHDRAQAAVKAREDELKKFLDDEAKRLKVDAKKVEGKLDDAGKQKLAALKKEIEQLKKAVPGAYPTAHALKEGNVRNLNVLIRGNPATPGDEVPRRFLSVLSAAKPFTQGSGRLELAEAIASPDNPLTARVMANRLWHHHFGRGLVATTSNFGSLGSKPSHPELLDHLARRLIANGWSIKAMHKEIMLSEAYQRSSGPGTGKHAELDPDNKLLWRMNRRRLEVEAWRDAMLDVAGNLDRELGGPSISLTSPDNRRRTLYGKISRHELDSLLRLFDFPDPNITSGTRSETTVALQQLFVFNSDFMRKQARSLADRLTREADRTDAQRIGEAFRLLYGRKPSPREVERGVQFLTQTKEGWELYAQVLLSANEFMYVD
ncbi:MAG: DUF1553 domain-containing protein [Gemmataceae bacterium]